MQRHLHSLDAIKDQPKNAIQSSEWRLWAIKLMIQNSIPGRNLAGQLGRRLLGLFHRHHRANYPIKRWAIKLYGWQFLRRRVLEYHPCPRQPYQRQEIYLLLTQVHLSTHQLQILPAPFLPILYCLRRRSVCFGYLTDQSKALPRSRQSLFSRATTSRNLWRWRAVLRRGIHITPVNCWKPSV